MDTGQQSDPSGVVFDTSSGISLEEQQEILAGIDAVTGGSRLVPEASESGAKKRGILFPLLINIGALVLLGLGLVLLSMLHGNDEQSIRESSSTLGITERKLIQEIRRQTNTQISEKEKEIDGILSRLSAVDSEYRELQVSVESLTEAQKDRAQSLLKMQEDYRDSLSALQEERADILEESRMREAALRVQSEEGQQNLSAAMEELNALSAEKERTARVENQMGAYYAVLGRQINAGRLDEASATLGAMKEFLNAPSFQTLNTLRERRQSHLAAIAAMEEAVAEARRKDPEGAAAGDLAAAYESLKEEHAVLEKQLEAQGQMIAASNASGSEQGRKMAEYLNTIAELQTASEAMAARIEQSEAELAQQRLENANLLQEKDALQSEHNDIQEKLDAALKLFQGN